MAENQIEIDDLLRWYLQDRIDRLDPSWDRRVPSPKLERVFDEPVWIGGVRHAPGPEDVPGRPSGDVQILKEEKMDDLIVNALMCFVAVYTVLYVVDSILF